MRIDFNDKPAAESDEDPASQKFGVPEVGSPETDAPLIGRKFSLGPRNAKFQNSAPSADVKTAAATSRLATDPAPIKPRKKPGRPAGQPKTGGREKLVGITPDELRAAIGSIPITVLLDISLGRKMRVGAPNGSRVWRYPSLSERQQAANKLLARVLPELQKSETTLDASVASVGLQIGADGGLSEMARRLAFVLQKARLANGAPAAIEHEPIEYEPAEPIELGSRARAREPVEAVAAPARAAEPTSALRVVNGGGRWWCQDIGRSPPKLLAGFLTEAEALAHLKALGGTAPAPVQAHPAPAPARPAPVPAPVCVPETRRFANPAEHGVGRSRPAVLLRRPERVWRRGHAA